MANRRKKTPSQPVISPADPIAENNSGVPEHVKFIARNLTDGFDRSVFDDDVRRNTEAAETLLKRKLAEDPPLQDLATADKIAAVKLRYLFDLLLNGERHRTNTIKSINPAKVTPGSPQWQQLVDYANGITTELEFDVVDYIYRRAIRARVEQTIKSRTVDRNTAIGAAYLLGVDYHEPLEDHPALETILRYVYVDISTAAAGK